MPPCILRLAHDSRKTCKEKKATSACALTLAPCFDAPDASLSVDKTRFLSSSSCRTVHGQIEFKRIEAESLNPALQRLSNLSRSDGWRAASLPPFCCHVAALPAVASGTPRRFPLLFPELLHLDVLDTIR